MQLVFHRMKRSHRRGACQALLAGGLALCALVLVALATSARPAQGQAGTGGSFFPGPSGAASRPGTVGRPPAAQPPSWVTALQSGQGSGGGVTASTANLEATMFMASSGGVSNATAAATNGGLVTYTVIITNINATAAATNLLILDPLSDQTFDNVRCVAPSLSACTAVQNVSEVTDPLGGEIPVTTTSQISWTVASVPAATSKNVALLANRWIGSFQARIVGQSDGTIIYNQAFIRYKLNSAGSNLGTMTQDLQTIVRAGISPGPTYSSAVSPAPTWISQDQGGTISMDWGDFDHDGWLDLAVGSTAGTSVYRNENGKLVLFWSNSLYTLGVRWADVNGDGNLELIAVGASSGASAEATGQNYIYGLTPAGTSFEQLSEFDSPSQLLRVEAADFRHTGKLDLVASTNAIDAPCGVIFYPNQGGTFGTGSECVSKDASAAMAAADFDNDGYPGLVLGDFPDKVILLPNTHSTTYPLTTTNVVDVDSAMAFLPYDFAWGDYDGDGNLDLAAAFPLDRRVRIYHNNGSNSFSLYKEIETNQFRTPMAVRWGNFGGTGRMDLAVADSPPAIYLNDARNSFSNKITLSDAAFNGSVWAMAAGDASNSGTPDLALANRDGSSVLFTNFSSPLSRTPVSVGPNFGASSVAWGDADSDGEPDLIFGASSNDVTAKLLHNSQGTFPTTSSYPETGFGPHSVAFGDVYGTGKLATAIGTPEGIQLYKHGAYLEPAWSVSQEAMTLAFGDATGDGFPDLLAGTSNSVVLYHNLGTPGGTGSLGTAPVFTTTEAMTPTMVAWADCDGDGYLDFAVSSDGGPRVSITTTTT